MNVVLWVEYTVKPGKLQDFRQVVDEMNSASETEAGFLDQEIFAAEDGMSGFINERYRTEEEMVEHVHDWRATYAERFFAACDVNRLQLLGNLSSKTITFMAADGEDRIGKPRVAQRVRGFSK